MGIDWKVRERKGYPKITIIQFKVMERMMEAQERGQIWVDLSDVSKRTINRLIKYDFIYSSLNESAPTYRLNARGEEMYRFYQQPLKRTDGLCPVCGKAPRIGADQRCLECNREQARKYYDRKRREMFMARLSPEGRHVEPKRRGRPRKNLQIEGV